MAAASAAIAAADARPRSGGGTWAATWAGRALTRVDPRNWGVGTVRLLRHPLLPRKEAECPP